jgi:hypothetical protein
MAQKTIQGANAHMKAHPNTRKVVAFASYLEASEQYNFKNL